MQRVKEKAFDYSGFLTAMSTETVYVKRFECLAGRALFTS